MAGLRAVWRWLAGRPWLTVVALMVAGNVAAFGRLEAERRDRATDDCVQANETRATIRVVAKDTALEVGESIIEVASQGEETPSDETVTQFRGIMARRLDAIVAQLEDEDCR